MLWIAFRIVFLLMIPNRTHSYSLTYAVVNCFQNCIFTYDSQRDVLVSPNTYSCELLSELYFYLWFPTGIRRSSSNDQLWIAFRIVFLLMIPNCFFLHNIASMLWIAFRIVFLLMIPNNDWRDNKLRRVVNCFQNCIFTYDSQQQNFELFWGNCCELLSELYFYLWFPTFHNAKCNRRLLWIAFRIVFLLMIPNILYK